MSNNAELIYQNGLPATEIATLSQNDYSVYIQTDDEDMVGVRKTIIRDCDHLNRLLELNLYIEIKANTYPDFVTPVKTDWEMNVNDTEEYRMPAWSDPEGNDVAEIYVTNMTGQEKKYPPFMNFEEATNTLSFRPVDFWTSGKTYFFQIVIKEKNSDSIQFVYYC